jgi:hypothetical protein
VPGESEDGPIVPHKAKKRKKLPTGQLHSYIAKSERKVVGIIHLYIYGLRKKDVCHGWRG